MSSKDLFEKASKQFTSGKYEDAIESLNQLISSDPPPHLRAQLLFNRGMAFYHLGKFQDAVEDMTMAIDFKEPVPEKDQLVLFHYRRALSYLNLPNRFSEAMQDLDTSINLDPSHAPSLFRRGTLHIQNRNYQDAVKDLMAATQSNPRESEYSTTLGILLCNIGRLEEGSEILERSLELSPQAFEKNALAWLYLAEADKVFKKTLRAAERFKKAAQIATEDTEPKTREQASKFALNSGETFLAAGKFDDAIEMLKWSSELQSEAQTANFLLGTIYTKMGKFGLAAEAWSKADQTLPNVKMNYAVCLNQIGKEEEAMKLFDVVFKEGTEKSAIFYRLYGEGLLKIKNYSKALEVFSRAVSIHPEDESLNFYVGESAYNIREIAKAVEFYGKAVELKPSNAMFNFAYANSILELEDNGKELKGKCIEAFKRAVSIEPNNKSFIAGAARAFLNLEEYEEVIDILEPNSEEPDIFFQRGIAFYHLRKHEECIESMREYLKLETSENSRRNALRFMGESLQFVNNFEEAVTVYESLVKIAPEHDVYWYYLGRSLQETKNPEKAAVALEKAVNIQEEKGQFRQGADVVLNSLGQIYNVLRRYDDALKAYTKATEVNPGDDSYWLNAGIMLVRLEKYTEALKMLEKAVSMKESTMVFFYIAECNSELGQIDTAIDALTSAIRLADPPIATLYHRRSSLLLLKEDFDGAEVDLNKALELEPGNKALLESQKRFEEIKKLKNEN